MTREERTYVSPSDLTEIELRCANPNCRARVSSKLTSTLNLPFRCTNCNRTWFQAESDAAYRSIQLLISGLNSLAQQPDFEVRLHIKSVSE